MTSQELYDHAVSLLAVLRPVVRCGEHYWLSLKGEI